MVGIRAKDHDDKRQLILDRAAELFARQGFHKTSISEISKACNVTSKAWIYHYFPNKEEVLFTLLRDFLELVSRRLRASMREDHPPRVALRAFVGECLSIYAQYRINYPMLFAEMAALPPVPQAVAITSGQLPSWSWISRARAAQPRSAAPLLPPSGKIYARG